MVEFARDSIVYVLLVGIVVTVYVTAKIAKWKTRVDEDRLFLKDFTKEARENRERDRIFLENFKKEIREDRERDRQKLADFKKEIREDRERDR